MIKIARHGVHSGSARWHRAKGVCGLPTDALRVIAFGCSARQRCERDTPLGHMAANEDQLSGESVVRRGEAFQPAPCDAMHCWPMQPSVLVVTFVDDSRTKLARHRAAVAAHITPRSRDIKLPSSWFRALRDSAETHSAGVFASCCFHLVLLSSTFIECHRARCFI